MASVPASPHGTSRLPKGNVLMAVPKKGRLYEKVVKVLEGAGLEYRRQERVDVAFCKDLPVTLVFLPAADIAAYVGEGNVDIGITGLDVMLETRLGTPDIHISQLLDLGFGKCRLSVQAPVKSGITGAAELSGARIVTSFPALTRAFFDKFDAKSGKTTKIRTVSGSVEAACGLGLADAVVDLVETGTTMRAAGLEVVDEVLVSESVLISNPDSPHQDLIKLIQRRIEGYITATKFMMISYNVTRDLLDKALLITPGKRSPTVSTLEEENWVAVQALVERSTASNKMDQLEQAGAVDILLFSISNSRM